MTRPASGHRDELMDELRLLAAVLGLAGEGGDKKEADTDAAVSEHVSV
ncbi:MAG TPA: hypothetical protein VIK99_06890 [Thermaerobacter sp.]